MSTDGPSQLVSLLACGVLLLGLAGCSDDEPERELDIADASDSTPADAQGSPSGPGETAPPGVPDPRPAPEQGEKVEDDVGVWALRLPEQEPARTVAQTFVDYMDVRTRAYHTGEASLPELARVAVGQPLTDVQGYVLDLQERGLHTVGDTWFTLTDENVRVRGGTATLSGVCARNATVDVNQQNVAQESPPDAYRVQARVVRVAPEVWLVDEVSFQEATGGDC